MASPRLTTGEAQLLRPHPLSSQALQRDAAGRRVGGQRRREARARYRGATARCCRARAMPSRGCARVRAVQCMGILRRRCGLRRMLGRHVRLPGPDRQQRALRARRRVHARQQVPEVRGAFQASAEAGWRTSPVLKIEVVAYRQHPWAHACAWGGGGCKRAARAAVSAGVLGWARMRQGPPPQRVFPWGTWARCGCALVAAEWRSQQLAERAAAGGPSQSRWVQRLRRHV